MLLTIFLAIVFCASITLMLISAVAFVQDIKLFSSAPKEAREVLVPRESELFKGARVMGWALITFSMVMILGADMIFFDYFLLMKFHFFQHYYPEVESVYEGRKYGYNIKSQLLKLLVIFPAASALAAWICTLFYGC